MDGGAAAVAGVQLLNISLRMLHVRKQAPWQRPFVAALQRALRDTPLGTWFFASVAKPAVRPCCHPGSSFPGRMQGLMQVCQVLFAWLQPAMRLCDRLPHVPVSAPSLAALFARLSTATVPAQSVAVLQTP